jgi:predicted ATPase
VPEIGRAVVREELAAGGDALPWGDERAFAEKMWPREVAAHVEALRLGTTVILDRGVPDVVGFLRMAGLPVPAHIDAAARVHRYNARVFLAPFWEEIYAHDPERRQAPELARAAEAAMRETYTGYGYLPIELPRVPVEERVAFVLDHLAG